MPRAEPPPGGPASAGPCARHDQALPSSGLSDLVCALRIASVQRGLDCSGARLIHHYSNAVYYLPEERIVARVTQGTDACRRLALAQRVAGWLVEQHNFPATAPVPGVEPVQVEPRIAVSYWRYYPQPASGHLLTSAHLGQLLRSLHAITQGPPVTLDRWIPLASLHAALNDSATALALRTDERDWLLEEVHRVRDELDHLDWPLGYGLIHGDAWAGNLLWDTAGGSDAAVLTDWDWVSCGPREIDLIPTWHAARRYGRGPAWTAAFVDRYGYDLAAWPGFTTLMWMRDLVQITGPLRRANDSEVHRKALRQRFAAIRAADTASTWTAL